MDIQGKLDKKKGQTESVTVFAFVSPNFLMFAAKTIATLTRFLITYGHKLSIFWFMIRSAIIF